MSARKYFSSFDLRLIVENGKEIVFKNIDGEQKKYSVDFTLQIGKHYLKSKDTEWL